MTSQDFDGGIDLILSLYFQLHTHDQTLAKRVPENSNLADKQSVLERTDKQPSLDNCIVGEK